MDAVRIAQASADKDIAAVAALFDAYAASLPVDLGYQNFAQERAGLPGAYAPPGGALLLARDGAGAALGCVALRALDETSTGEIKRLYVAPEARGLGLGKALLAAVSEAAIVCGHRALCLDTLPFMAEAQALYRAHGFREIPPYYGTALPGTVFFGKALP